MTCGSLAVSGLVAGAASGLVAWLVFSVAVPFGGWLMALLPIAGPVDSSVGWADRQVVLTIVAAGVVLDAVAAVSGRLPPPSVGRQVPQAWGRLLPAPVVGALYGARLGVGPLTILSTWGWWAALIGSAVLGPLPAVLVGSTFGLVRMAVMIGVSVVGAVLAPEVPARDVRRDDLGHPFLRLRLRQRSSRLALGAVGLVAVSAMAVSGCSGGGLDDAGDSVADAPPPRSTHPSTSRTTHARSVIAQSTETVPVMIPALPVSVPITVTAHLEDYVRPARSAQSPSAAVASPEVSSLSPDDLPGSLADALLPTVDGFEPVADPIADRFLDLETAASIQPDPTEEIALLETRGYLGGWTRAFRSDANDVAVATVYHFDDPAQAEFYLEDGLITIGGYGGRFFDIEGLPGVRGFMQALDDDDESLVSLGAAFHAGPRWYLVYIVGSPETVTPDVLVPAVAAQQASALAPVAQPGLSPTDARMVHPR